VNTVCSKVNCPAQNDTPAISKRDGFCRRIVYRRA
jgi:hypothetical protein